MRKRVCPGIATRPPGAWRIARVARALLVLALVAAPSAARAEAADAWRPDVKPVRDKSPPVATEAVATEPPAPVPSPAVEAAGAHPIEAGTADARPLATRSPDPDPPAGRGLVEDYCRVVVDHAVAAKLAEEKARAEGLRKEIDIRIAALKEATAEQQKWLRLRQEFQDKATDNLVRVYAQMDAEAAALRLNAVGEEIAAAILLKLPPKSASAVLGEMPPDMAGRLTAYMAGAAELQPRAAPPQRDAAP